MSLYRWIIAGLWLLFVAYWAVAAVGAKRSTDRSRRRRWRRWRWEVGLRLVVILLVAALLQSRSLRQFLAETQRSASHSGILGWTGVALCLLGFSLAISARWYLGRNWGLPMARKERPELVTSGPYAHMRHPIYTGLILATLGSAIGVNIIWTVLVVLVGAYFIFSARHEETVMLQQFPQEYAAYMARTGMLAPCPLRRR